MTKTLAELRIQIDALDQSLLIGGLAWPPELGWVPALALGVSLAAALLPTLGAYRVSVQELLQPRRILENTMFM